MVLILFPYRPGHARRRDRSVGGGAECASEGEAIGSSKGKGGGKGTKPRSGPGASDLVRARVAAGGGEGGDANARDTTEGGTYRATTNVGLFGVHVT